MSLDEVDRGHVSRRLLELSKEFAGQAGALSDTYHAFKLAERAYSHAKAKALLNAPIVDPADPERRRKLTDTDRKAWAEMETAKLADALVVADIANQFQQDAVWARNNELSALQTLSADARAEMKI